MATLYRKMRKLFRDEHGGLIAAEYLLLGTLLTIGLIVGISSVQGALIDQLEALAQLIYPTP
jgi:Flp pilus assembly pilin Flp